MENLLCDRAKVGGEGRGWDSEAKPAHGTTLKGQAITFRLFPDSLPVDVYQYPVLPWPGLAQPPGENAAA